MPSKTQSIVIGVAVSVVLGLVLGFIAANAGTVGASLAGCFSCVVALAAPMIAVWHYTNTHGVTLAAGQGAGIGAAVGAIGGLLSAIVQRLLITAGVFPDPVAQAREIYEAQGMSPEQIDQAMGMVQAMSGPVVGIVSALVIGALIGAIGGAIGAAIFKRGDGFDEV